MAFAGRLVTAEIAMFEAVKERSDHAPVWIELAEAKGRSPRRRRDA
jgi:exonuclease III